MAPRKTATQPVDQATKFVEEATAAVTEAAKTGAKQLETQVAKAHEQAEEARKAAIEKYEEAAIIGQGNLEAVVASGTVVAKGMETFGQALYAYAQSSFDANVKAVEAMMHVKSLPELLELQSALTRSSFDRAVSEGHKLTELGVQVANDAAKPLTDRIAAAS